MGKGPLLAIFVLCFLAAVFFILNSSGSAGRGQQGQNATAQAGANETALAAAPSLKIASWNLQAFGEKKSGNSTLMALYSKAMKQYDIIFIEEIRDSAGAAFPKLCALMEGYECANSSRAGRSASKEQYGIIYRGVKLAGTKDYNPDAQDRWERPPFQATFSKGSYSFTALVEHTKPENTTLEMAALDALASNLSGNVVVLGDLNADCDYYPAKKDFAGWAWAISTGTDTTSKNTTCTYDRIIFNRAMAPEFVSSGVFSANVTPDMSDHYLVWAQISPADAP
jgi:deoxyribonuclease-1/deoxyribonuclease-1-like protein